MAGAHPMKLIWNISIVLVVASSLGACRAREPTVDEAPASDEVETKASSPAAENLDESATECLDGRRIYTERTPMGPRVRTSADLNDMGLHRPTNDAFAIETGGTCGPSELSDVEP
jgi:hypothetical protein